MRRMGERPGGGRHPWHVEAAHRPHQLKDHPVRLRQRNACAQRAIARRAARPSPSPPRRRSAAPRRRRRRARRRMQGPSRRRRSRDGSRKGCRELLLGGGPERQQLGRPEVVRLRLCQPIDRAFLRRRTAIRVGGRGADSLCNSLPRLGSRLVIVRDAVSSSSEPSSSEPSRGIVLRMLGRPTSGGFVAPARRRRGFAHLEQQAAAAHRVEATGMNERLRHDPRARRFRRRSSL